MTLTKYGKEKMGFTEFPESDSLEILFGIIRVYSLQGVNFKPDSELTHSEVFGFGDNCVVAVSNSINEACQLLTGDNLIEDSEEEWIKQKKATPPFVLIYFKEFQTRILNGGHRKEHDGCIYTYDAFPEGKKDIKKWEKESLPIIFTALTVHFSKLDRPTSLIPVERSIFGTTNSGSTLFDIKLTGSATLIVSSGKTTEEINESLEKSSALLSKLTYKSSRHIYSALNEPDRLKQFMSYFLFLERHTHSHFKSLSYKKNAHAVFNVPERVSQSSKLFFESRFNDSKNLAQRFHWCAILVWQQLNDQDVKDFLDIKKIRDKLTHGEDIEESELPVEKAKLLTLKLLGAE